MGVAIGGSRIRYLTEKEHSSMINDLGIGSDVIVQKCQKKIYLQQGHIKIGTTISKSTKAYFKAINIDIEVIKIEGSVELAPY
jgi:ATP phosphoribosyltransferase